MGGWKVKQFPIAFGAKRPDEIGKGEVIARHYIF